MDGNLGRCLRAAEPGRYTERISGDVVFNDDTYAIDAGALRDLATQPNVWTTPTRSAAWWRDGSW